MWFYFLGHFLVYIRVVFLPDCLLILSLLKHKNVSIFLNKKNEDLKQVKPFK